MDLFPVLINQRRRLRQTESFHRRSEIGKVDGILEGGDITGSIDTTAPADLLDEADVEANRFQTRDPTQPGPGVPAVEGFVGERAADEGSGQKQD